MTTADAGRSARGGQPATLADLITALTALSDMDPVTRARACPNLIDTAKGVLARERAAAMLEAADALGHGGQVELARQLGVSRGVVAEGIRVARNQPA